MFKVKCTHKNGQISVTITGADTATSAKEALEWSIRKYKTLLKCAEKYPFSNWPDWIDALSADDCPLCQFYKKRRTPEQFGYCRDCPLNDGKNHCDEANSAWKLMRQLYDRNQYTVGFQIMLAALIKARKFVEDK
jgi:hypothetical protein